MVEEIKEVYITPEGPVEITETIITMEDDLPAEETPDTDGDAGNDGPVM
ncbi:MAG: hypothetical protein NTW29_06815 [Bacteroidetes bacterium]|nr:hypothetical protein [Bacteroidota bacterium]